MLLRSVGLHLAAWNGKYLAFVLFRVRLLGDTNTPVTSIPNKGFDM
jgi:hypothetical protein